MLAALLVRSIAGGRNPHVVAPGGRKRFAAPRRIDAGRDDHRAVGADALMLAAYAPVWVGSDRASGALAAAEAGADLILMPADLEDPAVVADRTVLTIDAGRGLGNGLPIPAGPLHAPLPEQLAQTDALVLVGSPPERDAARGRWPLLAGAVNARLTPRQTGLSLAGERVVAFSGMERPERFFSALREMGAELLGAEPFPEGCDYPAAILRRLLRRARSEGAMLVTTERDALRLPDAFRREVVVVQLGLEPEDWEPLDRVLLGPAPFRLNRPELP